MTMFPSWARAWIREQRTNLAKAILKQAGYTWEGGVEPTWDADDRQVTPGWTLDHARWHPGAGTEHARPQPRLRPAALDLRYLDRDLAERVRHPAQAHLAGFNVIVPIIFTEQDFDMYILGWSLGIFPDYLYDFFAEEQAVQDGNNAGGYINPEFEELLQKLLTCESFDECKEISDQSSDLCWRPKCPMSCCSTPASSKPIRSASVEYPYTEGSAVCSTPTVVATLQTSVKIK